MIFDNNMSFFVTNSPCKHTYFLAQAAMMPCQTSLFFIVGFENEYLTISCCSSRVSEQVHTAHLSVHKIKNNDTSYNNALKYVEVKNDVI